MWCYQISRSFLVLQHHCLISLQLGLEVDLNKENINMNFEGISGIARIEYLERNKKHNDRVLSPPNMTWGLHCINTLTVGEYFLQLLSELW